MENLLNPVIVAVLLLCVLCLLKVNVLLSMLISLFVAGLIGGLPIVSSGDEASIMSSVVAGFSGNAETALAYVLLGTFASAMAYTGITEILSKKIAKFRDLYLRFSRKCSMISITAKANKVYRKFT